MAATLGMRIQPLAHQVVQPCGPAPDSTGSGSSDVAPPMVMGLNWLNARACTDHTAAEPLQHLTGSSIYNILCWDDSSCQGERAVAIKNGEQLWVEAFLEFLNLPNADQMYQECLNNGLKPCLLVCDGERERTFPIKLFNYERQLPPLS